MKLKTLILGAALGLPLLALADASSSNPFAGIYAGFGLGALAGTGKVSSASTLADLDGDDFTAEGSGSIDHGSMGVNGNIFGGYNFALGSNWLLGLQAEYDYNSAKISESGTITATDTQDPPDVVVGQNSATVKLQQTYGLDADLGYLLTPDSMIYVGAGWVSGKVKASAEESLVVDGDLLSGGAVSTSKTVSGIKGLVGAQQSLGSNMSLREEMSYTQFNSVSQSVATVVANPVTPSDPIVDVTNLSSKIRFLTTSVAFVYGFNM